MSIRCPICNKKIKNGQTHCTRCGWAPEPAVKEKVCAVCHTHLDVNAKFCPKCGTATQPTCPTCHAELKAEDAFCPACGTALHPAKPSAPVTGPTIQPMGTRGGFVITPYGPMFVFDAPYQPPQPVPVAPQPEPEVVEEVVIQPRKRKNRAIVGLIFSILSILLCPIFPFALLGIGLGASGHSDRPKTGTAAIILGLIGLLMCIAACVWVAAFGGWEFITGLFAKEAESALALIGLL